MVIVGLPTSQSFHRAVLEEPEFLSGKYDIGYVERHGTILEESAPGESELEAMAVAAALAEDAVRGAAHPDGQSAEAVPVESAWLRLARERGLR
jgi:acetyl/propionyl-CoA carboxylase alpha subunit